MAKRRGGLDATQTPDEIPPGNTAEARTADDQQGERDRRLEVAALNEALAAKRCRACAIAGNWDIYNRERSKGRVRYIKCKCCGHTDHVPVIVAK